MAGKGIASKYVVKPDDGPVLDAAAAARATFAPSNGSWQRQSSPNAHHYAAQAAGMMAPKD